MLLVVHAISTRGRGYEGKLLSRGLLSAQRPQDGSRERRSLQSKPRALGHGTGLPWREGGRDPLPGEHQKTEEP